MAISITGPGFPEISPATAGQDVFISTDRSYRCRWVDREIRCGTLYSQKTPSEYWRRSYAGVFSAEHVDGQLVTYVHGENKNEMLDSKVSWNTINHDHGGYSGVQPNGSYADYWPGYFAFASMATPAKDYGPILWPAAGYLNSKGEIVSHGVRHPFSIVANGYVWLFALDTSPGHGISVSRAPIDDALWSRGYRTLTRDGRWALSRPVQGEPLKYRGPDSRAILGARTSYTFAVSRAAKGFIGLESGLVGGEIGTTVWLSDDLMHWHQRPGPRLWPSSSWGSQTARYPRPVDGTQAIVATGSDAAWMDIPS